MIHVAFSDLLVVTQAASDQTFWNGATVAAFVAAAAAFVAALFAALVSFVAAMITVVAQLVMASRQRSHEMRLEAITENFSLRQQEVDWRVRQINELYGPLQMYRATSKRLRESLPAFEKDGTTRWRLVMHIPDAKANPGQKIVVEEILSISKAIESLLLHKAGLMEATEPTENFAKFMHHSRLLRIAWRHGGVLGTGPGQVDVTDVPFPDAVDEDISKAVTRIRAALAKAQTPLPT